MVANGSEAAGAQPLRASHEPEGGRAGPRPGTNIADNRAPPRRNGNPPLLFLGAPRPMVGGGTTTRERRAGRLEWLTGGVGDGAPRSSQELVEEDRRGDEEDGGGDATAEDGGLACIPEARPRGRTYLVLCPGDQLQR